MMLITRAGNPPVKILNRNKVVGYFVPKSALVGGELELASKDQVTGFIRTKLAKIGHILDHLGDK